MFLPNWLDLLSDIPDSLLYMGVIDTMVIVSSQVNEGISHLLGCCLLDLQSSL